MNFFNLSPVEQGRTLATLDEQIRTTVAQKIADGISERDLREEFEIALSQIEPHISPADAGSLLRVMDEAVNEAQRKQAAVSPPVHRLR